MKTGTLSITAALALALGGCSTITPVVEVSHTSHALQHMDGTHGANGFDVASAGLRWRPIRGLTIDALEGYTPETLDRRHEVFNGRITYEFHQAAP